MGALQICANKRPSASRPSLVRTKALPMPKPSAGKQACTNRSHVAVAQTSKPGRPHKKQNLHSYRGERLWFLQDGTSPAAEHLSARSRSQVPELVLLQNVPSSLPWLLHGQGCSDASSKNSPEGFSQSLLIWKTKTRTYREGSGDRSNNRPPTYRSGRGSSPTTFSVPGVGERK